MYNPQKLLASGASRSVSKAEVMQHLHQAVGSHAVLEQHMPATRGDAQLAPSPGT